MTAICIAGATGWTGRALVGGVLVHSVRLPSFVVSTEVIFGLPDERLSIRHDAGSSPAPYVAGTLLAARGAWGLPVVMEQERTQGAEHQHVLVLERREPGEVRLDGRRAPRATLGELLA